ncbi:MAG: LeoA/HP0731 family dynamin-like GTPase [Billgrantia sp.]
MEQFKNFDAEKSAVVDSLNKLRGLVATLGDIGLDVDEDISKIQNAIADIESDILRIALLGAFSDGKTSVIAGWLGQVMDDMKIDTDESSDSLAIYRPENSSGNCEIVDTPGLFGDKEKANGNNIVKYGDITKKYLSEAHLIFYVVDATNPLKESHCDVVRWILRDLNKLSSTIFVINKMDEVADLRDAEDYENQATIKKQNLLEKLQRFVELSDSERLAVNVVCIASNPNGRGLNFWFEKKEAYEERSRINSLKEITSSIINSTTRNELVKKTGLDVISDVMINKISLAEAQFKNFELLASSLMENSQRINEDIEQGKKNVLSAKSDLFEELNNEEKRLLGRLRTVSRNEVADFLEDEIGYTSKDIGYKLRIKIEQSCERCFQQSSQVMRQISVGIERQLESSEKFADAVKSSAFSYSQKAAVALKFVKVDNAGVLAARDVLAKVTGYTFKFKPWGAVKLAGNISRALPILGAALQVLGDVVSVAQQQSAENELAEIKKELGEIIKGHFKEVYDILSDNEKVFENFAPQIKSFQAILRNQNDELEELLSRKESLGAIKQELEVFTRKGDIIEGEFTAA